MKKISTNQIISQTSKQPFTGRSLKFLQDARDENDAAIIKGIITSNLGGYSLTVPYVISGCVVSDSGKDVTDGEIFYGGKFYQVTGVNGTTNVAQFVLTKTQDATADPLLFSDSVSKNVHDIYTYVATDTATPGDFDSSDLTSMYGAGRITNQTTLATQSTSSATFATLTGLTYTTPNDGVTRTYQITFICSALLDQDRSGTLPEDNFLSGIFRLYNSTDAVSLDDKTVTAGVYLDLGVGGSNILNLYFRFGVNCGTIVTLAPNKTIEAQFKTDGDLVTATDCKMMIVEI